MSDANLYHFCPECGCPDVEFNDIAQTAKCPACGWSGSAEDTVATFTRQRLWTVEDLANAMLQVLGIYAVAPLLQVLTEFGIIPKETPESTEVEKEYAAKARDRVMKAVFEKATTAAFEEAARVRAEFLEAVGKESTDVRP